MTQRRKLTRREFIQLSGLAAAGAVIASCKAPATEVPATEAPAATKEPDAPAAPVSKYKEAPMVAEMAGSLPPVDERLPMNPWVCPVAEMVGNYGGTIRRGFKGVSDRWGPTKHIDRCMTYYSQDLVLQPRLIESWDVSDDATTFTLHLRKGVKWNDGTEFTSANFKWFYENQAKNPDISASPPGSHSSRGADGKAVLCEMEFPDDYTVVFKFAHPNPLWIYGTFRSNNGFFTPEYMAQFHMELVDDKAALEAKVKEAGFAAWNELFEDRNWWYLNNERPQLYPWVAKNSLADELFIMERNPWFFGVDPEGNQLPYLDTITHRLFETTEVFNMWIINGEIDFQNRHVGINNYTLFKENEANGDYKVFLGTSAGHSALQLNLATKEPRLNEFFNNRDVRIAISYAMNRDEVNELIYDGLLTPRQYSPLKLSPNYYEKLSNAYIEYDPAKANEMLDAAGYEKGADGFRTFKDGETISFIIEGTAEPGSSGEDEVQLVVKYLNDVGIKATYKYFERSLYTEHFQANEIEGAWWGGDRTVVPLAPGAPIFRGTMIDRPWASGFGIYFNSSGTDPNSVEPPADHFINKIWAIWDQIAQEPNPDQQNALLEQIMDIWAEEIPMVGLLGESPSPIIVKNGFRNYLPGFPMDDTTGDEHLLNTECYFWENPEEHSG
jgi:peptide/nickel transport system substrate-binding protein